MKEPELVLVLFTAATPEDVAALGRTLVEEGLAACLNVIPSVRSIYRWEGELRDDSEALGLLKARRDRTEALIARIRSLHAYTVPEVIALPVVTGNPDYLRWASGDP